MEVRRTGVRGDGLGRRVRQKVGRTSKSVKNPEKRRVFAASELSRIHGNGFESTFVVRVQLVRLTQHRKKSEFLHAVPEGRDVQSQNVQLRF